MLILIAGTNGNIHSLGKYPDKLHRVEYETMRRGLGGSPGNKRQLSLTALEMHRHREQKVMKKEPMPGQHCEVAQVVAMSNDYC